jgi:hypothetical protein
MANRGVHRTVLNGTTPPHSVCAMQMQQGEYAEITEGAQRGRILGRMYDNNGHPQGENFFTVDNPRSTWRNCTFHVRILQPGETFTVTIGETR